MERGRQSSRGGAPRGLQLLPGIPQHQNQLLEALQQQNQLPSLPDYQPPPSRLEQQQCHRPAAHADSCSSLEAAARCHPAALKDADAGDGGSQLAPAAGGASAVVRDSSPAGGSGSSADSSSSSAEGSERTSRGLGPAKDADGFRLDLLAHSCSQHDCSIYDLYTRRRKFVILFTTSLAAIIVPLSTTMYLPALKAIQVDLHTNETLVASSVAINIFMVGLCALFWGPASDRFGRRTIYLISHSLFLVVSMLCIFAPNIAALVAFRAMQGAAVAAYGACNAGVAADVFRPAERGSAMGVSAIPVLVGPIIGPLLGGALTQSRLGWRATFVFISALAGLVVMPLLVLVVPETHQYKTLMALRRTDLKRAESIREAHEISSAPPAYRAPWYPIRILLDSRIILHSTLTLLCFGSYLCAVTMLPMFLAQPPYSLKPALVGVAFLPVGIAGILGCPLGGRLCDRSAANDPDQPMRRLHHSNLVVVLVMPAALMAYGWSLQCSAHIALPLAAIFMVQLSNSAYLPAIFGYLTQVQQRSAAAAAAGIYATMFIVSGLLIQVAAAAITRIGPGPIMTAVAGLVAACALAAAVQIRRTCWPACGDSGTSASSAAAQPAGASPENGRVATGKDAAERC